MILFYSTFAYQYILTLSRNWYVKQFPDSTKKNVALNILFHKSKELSKIILTFVWVSRIGRLISIIETCTSHYVERTILILEIKNITPNITLNSTLFQTGNNNKNLDLHTQNQMCTTFSNIKLQFGKKCIKLNSP